MTLNQPIRGVTPAMPRTGTRADYRHFPPEYADLIREFARTGTATLGPMHPSDARTSIRDLYRYRMFLLAATEADRNDTYAQSLFDTFNTCTLKLVRDSDNLATIHFILNPIVAAMRRSKEDAP